MNFYGLIGEKLGHSLSEPIHRLFFELTGILGAYKLIEITPDYLCRLPEALRLIGVRGINVTIPYKRTIMDYLDWIDADAVEVGAVNTVLLEDRKLHGFNTDVEGIRGLLKREEMLVAGKVAVVLGSGGAARAAVAALKKEEAGIIYMVSRNLKESDSRVSGVRLIDYEQLTDMSGDLIINCTPVGMYPDINSSVVGENIIERYDMVVDTIYNPVQTEFLRLSAQVGKQHANGLYMLVAQAMGAQQIWQGTSVDPSITEQIFWEMDKKLRGIR